MTAASSSQTLKSIFIATAVVCAGAGVLLPLADVGSVKVLAAVSGGALCLLLAFLSGNTRLFCLWGLMLTIPFDLSKRFGPIFLKMGGESSFRAELSDIFLLPLALYLARDIWTRRLGGLRVPKVTFIWMLIMLMGCFTVLLGPWHMTAAQEVVRMFKLMVLFLVICNELRRPLRVFHCAAALTLAMVVQAIAGLIQYFTGAHFGLELLGETGTIATESLMETTERGAKVFRVGAFLSHPNVFGIFLAVLLPIAIGTFLLRVGKGYRLFFLSSASLGMAALIVTLSRSGWVSFTAAFVLLMFLMVLHPGLRRRSIFAAVAASGALVAVSLVFYNQIMARIFDSRASAMLGREEYLRDAWGLITAKPWLGWGLNSYVLAVPPFTQYGARMANLHYKGWIPPVHNIYFLWWAETGIVGLALHLAMLGTIFWVGLGNLRVNDKTLFTVNAACLGGVLALLVDGFFSFSLRFNSILRVFWVLAGMIMAVHYWRLRQSAGDQSAQRAPSPVVDPALNRLRGGLPCDSPMHP